MGSIQMNISIPVFGELSSMKLISDTWPSTVLVEGKNVYMYEV